MAKLKTVEAMQQKLVEAQQDNHGRKARIAELEQAVEQQAQEIDSLRRDLSEARKALLAAKAA